MRNELETIEKIEQYLSGGMSAEETAAFQRQLTEDPGLLEQVRLQQEILSGIERTAWKEKIGRARTRYHFRQRLFKGGTWGMGAIILCAALTWWLVATRHIVPGTTASLSTRDTMLAPMLPTLPQDKPNTPQDTVFNSKGAILPPIPASQTFLIDGARDTVIETNAGIVFSIPAGTFLQDNGRRVTGPLQLMVREALDAASIIRSGLSTMSGDQLLETGGMFSIDAGKDGMPLKIDSTRGIYAEIPTDSVKPGMQLYTGKRKTNGTIDWVNPRPLEHDLVPVDILSLDFYPPDYLDSLRHWGYDSRNKKFTDSLYYSLAALFGAKSDSGYITVQIEPAPERKFTDTVVRRDTFIPPPPPLPICGINPAKIKAIWNAHFQETLLATREFAERIPWIHRTANGAILDLYVDMLNRPLSDIDSVAAGMLKGKRNANLRERFLSFYRRHEGRVRTKSAAFDRLGEYYRQKVKVYTEAITRTEKEYWDKQAALDRVANERTAAHEADSVARVTKNFEDELKLNVATVCRQLGYDPKAFERPPAKAVYSVTLRVTGWCNIDRAVYQSTADRTSMQWTDDQTGRTAHIDYRPVSIGIAQQNSFDRVYVYLVPDQLSSFMRMQEINAKFVEKLNGSITYTLICLAYKKDQAFYAYQQDLQGGDHPPVTLNPIGQKELDRQLNVFSKQKLLAEVQKETIYFRQNIADQARRQRNHELEQLRLRLIVMLFPCVVDEVEGTISPK